uniref:EF-hand domain-containing protein n=1 Tax=Arion vulgaris TaxID=1028688 RepID=A0A0B6ZEG6_9EUPU
MMIYVILLTLPAMTLAAEDVTVAQLFRDYVNSIDLNKDGDFSSEEIVSSLTAMDTNHDGDVNFVEFYVYLHSIHSNFTCYEADVFHYFASDVTDSINIAKIAAEK